MISIFHYFSLLCQETSRTYPLENPGIPLCVPHEPLHIPDVHLMLKTTRGKRHIAGSRFVGRSPWTVGRQSFFIELKLILLGDLEEWIYFSSLRLQDRLHFPMDYTVKVQAAPAAPAVHRTSPCGWPSGWCDFHTRCTSHGTFGNLADQGAPFLNIEKRWKAKVGSWQLLTLRVLKMTKLIQTIGILESSKTPVGKSANWKGANPL